MVHGIELLGKPNSNFNFSFEENFLKVQPENPIKKACHTNFSHKQKHMVRQFFFSRLGQYFQEFKPF